MAPVPVGSSIVPDWVPFGAAGAGIQRGHRELRPARRGAQFDVRVQRGFAPGTAAKLVSMPHFILFGCGIKSEVSQCCGGQPCLIDFNGLARCPMHRLHCGDGRHRSELGLWFRRSKQARNCHMDRSLSLIEVGHYSACKRIALMTDYFHATLAFG